MSQYALNKVSVGSPDQWIPTRGHLEMWFEKWKSGGKNYRELKDEGAKSATFKGKQTKVKDNILQCKCSLSGLWSLLNATSC